MVRDIPPSQKSARSARSEPSLNASEHMEGRKWMRRGVCGALSRPMAHSRVPAATSSDAFLGAGTSITTVHLHDQRKGAVHRVKHAPTVHVAHGYENHLPFLRAGRPIICLADWQFEPATQRHFWEQALRALTSESSLGDSVASAIVLVAGDMASAGEERRGSKSDSVPDLDWLFESFPNGDVYCVYGNHDLPDAQHLAWRSACSGLPRLLPHGAALRLPLVQPSTEPATVGHAESDGRAGLGVEATNDLVGSGQEASGEEEAEPIHADGRAEEGPPSVHQGAGKEPLPTAEQLAGLDKRDRAALWAACASGEKRAGAAPSKRDRQPRQRASRTQWPVEAQLEARLRQLHAGYPALLSAASNAPARGAAKGAARGAGCAASVAVAAAHGIPASYTQGLRKLERDDYFRAVDAALHSTAVDVLVTHANAKLPGLHDDVVRDEDAPRLYDAFLRSSASLLVHGHMHTEPVVAVVAPGKVVVNADCRVVVFAAAADE